MNLVQVNFDENFAIKLDETKRFVVRGADSDVPPGQMTYVADKHQSRWVCDILPLPTAEVVFPRVWQNIGHTDEMRDKVANLKNPHLLQIAPYITNNDQIGATGQPAADAVTWSPSLLPNVYSNIRSLMKKDPSYWVKRATMGLNNYYFSPNGEYMLVTNPLTSIWTYMELSVEWIQGIFLESVVGFEVCVCFGYSLELPTIYIGTDEAEAVIESRKVENPRVHFLGISGYKRMSIIMSILRHEYGWIIP